MTELPHGWSQAILGDLVKVHYGKGLSVRERDSSGRIPVVGSAGITGIHKHALVDSASIVIGRKGNAGAIWSLPGPSWPIDTTYFVVAPNGLDQAFLARQLEHLDLRELDSSTAIPSLRRRDLEASSLVVPPLAEQKRIVAAIEEHLSRLDAAKASLDRAHLRLEAFRSELVASAFGMRDSLGLDEEPDDARLPEGWTWRRASDACTSVVSGSTPPARFLLDQGDVPFIKVYNLRFDGLLDFTIKPTFIDRDTHEQRLKRSRLLPGDVLINIVGPPLGKVTVVPTSFPEWNMNQAIAAFRPGAELRGDLLAYLLMARPVIEPLLRTGKATAGQINLNISACRRLWLPVPPMDQQAALVSVLDTMTGTWERTCIETAEAGEHSGSLRRSILAAAFSGQLVPQDPDDEPASVLLERIRAEREAASSTRKRRVKT